MSNSFASALAEIISFGGEVALEGARVAVQTHDDGLGPDVSVAYFLRIQHLRNFRLSRRARDTSGNRWPVPRWERRRAPLRRNPK